MRPSSGVTPVAAPPLTEATPAGVEARPVPLADQAGPAGPEPPADLGFELLPDTPPHGLIRRFFTIQRHLIGLAFGSLVAHSRENQARGRKSRRRSFRFLFTLEWIIAALARPVLDKSLADRPVPVQLRRRLEILGPTFIKLGQVLALRQDILPVSVTEELKNLLDRLPVVSFPRYLEMISNDLGRPIEEMFSWIDPIPTGSASIAQIHRATTLEGDSVILKVVKPGIRQTLTRDAILIKLLGRILQAFLPRYQPKRVLAEFVEYTRREVDLYREADNAETFTANFHDVPGVVFPRIYRQYSGQSVLCMEFLQGYKPSAPEAQNLTDEERDVLVDLGAVSIIRMLFQDGFFHADLHPGNLLILPGPRLGFIDLGMVGRFDEELRQTLLYYYYSLVMGDAENAARYLAAIAQPAPGADPTGFRREVTEILARWTHSGNFRNFSLAQLILRSVNLGAQHRLYFPVEMVLMVKALVTFEGVGQLLKPGLDVAAISQVHANDLFRRQFSPQHMLQQALRHAPDFLQALAKAPTLIIEGLRLLESSTRRPQNPLGGLRGTLFGGFCMVAGAVLIAGNSSLWPVALILFFVGVVAALHRER